MAEGLSRRDMIKGAAVAGAAAWTAPVIIDSVMSPAAAASGNTGINCSKSLVWFTIDNSGTVYIAGFQDNTCQTCGCFGNFTSQNIGAAWACLTCPGTTKKMVLAPGTTNGYTNSTCGTSGATLSTATSYPTCDNYFTYGGGTVTAKAGVTILGAIGFGGNNINGYCPASSSTGNQVTGLGTCNVPGGGNLNGGSVTFAPPA